MKEVMKDVKSKGEVLDSVKVPVYETVEEAVKAKTPAFCLEAINKVVSDAITNAARAAKVRPSSPTAQLARIAKADPAAKAEIEKLLAKYAEGAA